MGKLPRNSFVFEYSSSVHTYNNHDRCGKLSNRDITLEEKLIFGAIHDRGGGGNKNSGTTVLFPF